MREINKEKLYDMDGEKVILSVGCNKSPFTDIFTVNVKENRLYTEKICGVYSDIKLSYVVKSRFYRVFQE